MNVTGDERTTSGANGLPLANELGKPCDRVDDDDWEWGAIAEGDGGRGFIKSGRAAHLPRESTASQPISRARALCITLLYCTVLYAATHNQFSYALTHFADRKQSEPTKERVE